MAPLTGVRIVERRDRVDLLEGTPVRPGLVRWSPVVGDVEPCVDPAAEVAVGAERLLMAGGAVGVRLYGGQTVVPVPCLPGGWESRRRRGDIPCTRGPSDPCMAV